MSTTTRHASSISSPRWLWLLLASTLLMASACGDDTPSGEEAEPVIPITVTAAQRGLGVFDGDAAIIGQVDAADELNAAFSHLVLRRQLRDELIISRQGTTALSDALFSATVEALRTEIDGALALDKTVLVLDLFRVSDGARPGSPEPYITSWDHNDRDPDRYGFWRGDLREAILTEVSTAATEQQPDIFVVGAEMERYLGMPGGLDDYANFVSLYQEAYAAIKAASPQTRVGVGIDWVRFRLDVVPQQVLAVHELPEGVDLGDEPGAVSCASLTGDEEDRALLEAACVEKAFSLYIEPLLRHVDAAAAPVVEGEERAYVTTADVLALSASPAQTDFGNQPATCPEDFFAPLRAWSTIAPVVYYDVQWRVTSSVGFNKQDEWYSVLVDRNSGVSVEIIAWHTLTDMVINDCGKLTGDLGAPASICLGGLWADSSAPKDVYDTIQTDVLPVGDAE